MNEKDASIGFGLNFGEIFVKNLVVVDHEFASNIDAVDIALGSDEDEIGVRIFESRTETRRVDKQ